MAQPFLIYVPNTKLKQCTISQYHNITFIVKSLISHPSCVHAMFRVLDQCWMPSFGYTVYFMWTIRKRKSMLEAFCGHIADLCCHSHYMNNEQTWTCVHCEQQTASLKQDQIKRFILFVSMENSFLWLWGLRNTRILWM